MVYNPATDFLALWRNIAGTVTKLDVPGLDYMVSAFARSGIITLSVSATAPVVSQSTTAWLQTAVPSYSAEGTLRLWDPVATAYVAATPALFFKMLQTAAAQNGVSWYTTTGGAPVNTVGHDGDFAIRTDEPGGVYGPKAAGAWPAAPIPGTTDTIGSTQLDLSFGSVEGNLIYRDAAVWQALAIGSPNTLLVSSGFVPGWETLSTLLDAVFSNSQGSLLYRGAALWDDLAPGVADQVLASGGPGANPAWAPRTAEFPSGTSMLFQQTAAPTGWTKQTLLNDYGLRVTSGAVGSVAGSAFSTVFAQTTVGNSTLSNAQLPNVSLPGSWPAVGFVYGGGAGGGPSGGPVNQSFGSGAAHNHSINLTLSYTDVIIAVKN